MKSYLVTGGTGFIGSALVKRLLSKGDRVRVFDNQARGNIKRLKEFSGKFEYINGDIRDPNKVLNATKNIDSVIHLAYINGTENFYNHPDLVLDVGVRGIINILDSAKKNKVSDFFMASSSEVYNDPDVIPTPENIPMIIPDPYNPRFSYSGGKIISELMTIHYAKNFFNRSIIFRPHNVYGPDMGNEHVVPQLIQKILLLSKKSKKIKLPIQGKGNNTRSFIYIDDFIDGLMLIIQKGKNNNTYNIGSDDEISIKNLVSILAKISNTNILLNQGPLPERSVMRRCPDIRRLKSLGFVNKTSLEDGLKKTYLWYNDNQTNHD